MAILTAETTGYERQIPHEAGQSTPKTSPNWTGGPPNRRTARSSTSTWWTSKRGKPKGCPEGLLRGQGPGVPAVAIFHDPAGVVLAPGDVPDRTTEAASQVCTAGADRHGRRGSGGATDGPMGQAGIDAGRNRGTTDRHEGPGRRFRGPGQDGQRRPTRRVHDPEALEGRQHRPGCSCSGD